ncbi:SDR family NAD(P)-dependent oxidoreductase [Spirosoma soli]|uniref:SDR family NAD(P)-dependent oxidoreductase n=1 Tax=Spirosoma soli TaxID=1770529 RepID=A0ABW5M5L8_9BACT
MQQVIRQYRPDDRGGNGNQGNSGSLEGSSLTNGDDLAGTTTGADTTGNGLPNLNDDNLGSADLGVTNLGSSAGTTDHDDDYTTGTVEISNVSALDRRVDADDDLVIADANSGTGVGAGGDLSSPGIGTLNDAGLTASGSADVDDDEIPEVNAATLVGSTAGAMGGLSETDASSGTAVVGSMSGTGIDPNVNLNLGEPEQATSVGSQSTGKTALITGASSGIGRELANLFAKDGYNLILVARSEDSLQQIAQEYEQQFGLQATVISRDLADPNAPDEIYAETQRQGLQIDVLVNDAGIGEYGKFATESDLQKELSIIQLNVTSLVHLTKLYLKDMVTRNEGKILMLGSIASVMPHPMMAVYGATKAFIYSFSEALRNELKDTNITITVLMPPATDTDFFNKAGATHTVAQEQARSMSAAEVAKTGYNALMKGKDKVAVGLMAKIMTAASYILPDAVVTQNGRNLLKSREEAKQDAQKTTIALAIGAAVIGGLWLLSRSRGNGAINTYDKFKYRAKVNSAKRSVLDALPDTSIGDKLTNITPIDSVVDSMKGTYHDAKAAVDKALV